MSSSDFVFAADPGHGGTRSGALTPGGYTREADLTLAVGLAAHHQMPSLLLTRYDDTTITYPTRARAMKAFGVDIVFCLHFDSDPRRPGHRGLDAYHYLGNGITRRVARYAVTHAPAELRVGKVICAQSEEGTVGTRYLTSIYPMDVVVLEMGFLSNDRDRKYVISTEGIDALGDLVISCCEEYRFIKRGRRDHGESQFPR